MEEHNFKFANCLSYNPERIVVFDTEANGLLHKVTKMWCIVAQDVSTKEVFVFTNELVTKYPVHGTLEEGVDFLVASKYVIAHNIMGYDTFTLNKFFPDKWNLKTVPLKKQHDTYIQSKVQWFDRPRLKGVKGNHGLVYYGELFKYPKPPIEDWSYWDEDKLHRCIVDVEINLRTFNYLNEEKRDRLAKGIDFSFQTSVAKQAQYWCTIQDLNGFPADIKKMKENLDYLDKEIDSLKSEIEPMLPKQVKPNAIKCTWEDIRDKWDGFFRKVPATEYEKAKRNGEIKDVPIKKAYMPTIKYLLKSGKYDRHTANWFDISDDPEDTNRMIDGPYTKVEFLDTYLTQHDVVKKFLLSLGWQPTEFTYEKDLDGNYVRDSKGQLVPKSPKLTEDSFESLPEGIGQKIARYNTLAHRRRTLINDDDEDKGWLNLIREDGRLSAGANVFNTSTGRAVQYGLVNVPSPAADFGKEMREVWIASQGCILVSTDMNSAQLVLLANYMEDEAFTEAVLSGKEYDENHNYLGTDAHTLNSIYFGLNTQEEVDRARETQDKKLIDKISKGRKYSKNGIYALLFGAGDSKFAKTLGYSSAAHGKEVKERYFKRLPKLKLLVAKLEKQFDDNRYGEGGYIQIAGGIWVYCMSKHKILNYLLMGSEAILQNVAIIWKNMQYLANNIPSKQLLTIHDEQTDECPLEYQDVVQDIMSRMYGEASKILKLETPVTGQAVTGFSYLDVH